MLWEEDDGQPARFISIESHRSLSSEPYYRALVTVEEPGAETSEKEASRRHVYLYSFAVCLENVIVFPSLWPRLESMGGAHLHAALGYAMAAFSLGRAVSALAINAADSTPRAMVVAGSFCYACSMAGGLLYVVADSPLQLVLSRAVSGLGAGALSLMIRTLVSLSTDAQRTSAMSNFFVAAALGEIAGPALTALTTGYSYSLLGEEISELNCAGLYTMVLFTGAFLFMSRSYARVSDFEAGERQGALRWALVTPRIALLFAMGMLTNFSVASWETVTVPLASDYFGWGVEANSWFFVVAGCLLFFVNVVGVRLAERLRWTDAHGLVGGVALALAGGGALAAWARHEPLFLLGNALYVMGIFSLLTYVSSMYTKQLVSHSAVFIGAFRSAGALARVGGNLLAAASLNSLPFGARALLCATAVALAALLVALAATARKEHAATQAAARDPLADALASFEAADASHDEPEHVSDLFPDRRDSFSSVSSHGSRCRSDSYGAPSPVRGPRTSEGYGAI